MDRLMSIRLLRPIGLLAAAGVIFLSLFGCSSSPADPAAQPPELGNEASAAVTAANGSDRELVENPAYRQWASFPVGTRVTQRMTTDSAKTPGKTVTTTVLTLIRRTDEEVVVESQATTAYADGRIVRNDPQEFRNPRWVPLPPGVKKEDWGRDSGGTEQGEETLEVLGQTYRCRWHKSRSRTDAGEMIMTTWSSPQMPGGLVRTVSLVPAVEETMTIEIVELFIPPQ